MTKGIVIDESKCNGCGLCVEACHEGALAIVNGKAKMVREDYCDGLGDCLPACPQDAITFVESCSCQTNPLVLTPGTPFGTAPAGEISGPSNSELRQWPIKLKLVSSGSPIFKGTNVLLAADCSAFSYAAMHENFIKGSAVAICCPKFETGLKEKLIEILKNGDPKSLAVVRMTVPCCAIDRIAREAIAASGTKPILKIVTIDQKGNVVKIEK